MNSAEQKRATCTVKLSGGLGNQMFQYAAGRALSLRTQSDLVIDTSFYERKRKRFRALELARFPIAGKFVTTKSPLPMFDRLKAMLGRQTRSQHRYREPHFHFDETFLRLRAPVTIEGYFQSERYFQEYARTIREELVIPQPTDPSVMHTGQQIADGAATSLHIRRGDYVTDKKASDVYEQIPSTAPVYVFSDDIAWAKKNLRDVKPLVFPDDGTCRSALDDLWLMSQASNHIIANSTFSWWGAWLAGTNVLGGTRQGVTIAPARWFKAPDMVDVDLIPQQWLRL
jgi:Glycosyl transferase family 11